MADERDIFKSNGWRQFCILRSCDHESLCEHAHFTPDEQNLLLIISQTCDLVNSTDKEPFIEVACLRPLDRAPSLENSHGKNSRCFELTLTINGSSNHYYLLAHERFFVRHGLLLALKPFAIVNADDVKDELIKWIIARYSRTAFPDSFDLRWKARKKQIEKVIKKLKLVQDIYVRILPFEELDDTADYNLDILLLMDPAHYENPAIYDEYSGFREELEDQFAQCAGITVDSVDLESSAGITVHQLQEYNRWDYSYLSYRSPEEHATPNK